ncbi:MAG TPA: MarR family transcriptional regulator [Firmicutes bacterium]|nr:MarR family transcriptional regulator [Bacillota bacterium]
MLEPDLTMDLIKTLEGLRRYRRWFRNRPLPIRHNEMMLLMFLSHHSKRGCGGIQPSELGNILRLTRPTITSLVNSLEDKDYVERIHDETDRRVVFVHLTAKGRELVEENRQEFVKTLSELIDYLGKDDARELIRLMGKVKGFLETKKAKRDGSEA